LLLANGISTLFGPTSAHIHDVGSVLQMIGLDAFLVEIQQGKPEVYFVFVDSLYNAGYLQFIWSEHSSEVQSKMIFMGHQILSCHVPVVRSFFILWKMLFSS
jgi:hypothetical protein